MKTELRSLRLPGAAYPCFIMILIQFMMEKIINNVPLLTLYDIIPIIYNS